MDKISFIIPAKNEALFIDKCINHIKNAILEWGGDSEIILIDNGSTDNTRNIASSMGVIIIESKEGGLGYLRNLGAKNSSGDILAFIDADCLIHKKWICLCVKSLEDINIAGVGARALPDKNNLTWVEETVAKLMAGSKKPNNIKWLGTSNLMIKKEVFWSVNGFDENLITGEDVHFCKKLNRKYKFSLEMRIDTIHLRESKTLKELFKREFWRGQSSLSVFKKSKYDLSELPSIVVPFINFLCFILFLFFYLLTFKGIALFFLLVNVILPYFLILKKRIKINTFRDFIKIYIISFTYLFSRSSALVYEVLTIIIEKLNFKWFFK